MLGGISAVIAVIDGSVKVWESARKDLRFSATFETVGNRLPILQDTLQICDEHFEPIKIFLSADAVQGLMKMLAERATLLNAGPFYLWLALLSI